MTYPARGPANCRSNQGENLMQALETLIWEADLAAQGLSASDKTDAIL